MAIGKDETTSNLVLECVQCKMKFLNPNDRDYHVKETYHKVKERYQCPKCEKHFGHNQILQLHLRVHESGVQRLELCHPQESEENCMTDQNSESIAKSIDLSEIKNHVPNSVELNNKQLGSSLPAKKFVGLTKIRLEDCLRCDACSCIYIDKNDYNKHMKNFHRQNSTKKHKQKRGCRSCCKHCNCHGNHQHQSLQKDGGNNNLFHYSIKDRWSKMVSGQLNPNDVKCDIKPDPDFDPDDVGGDIVDYSHLLSQVEVKIKTEPPEDPDYSCELGLTDKN